MTGLTASGGIHGSQQGGTPTPVSIDVTNLQVEGPWNDGSGHTFDHTALDASVDMLLVGTTARFASAGTTITYDGVSATGTIEGFQAANFRYIWAYWLAADLPTPGSTKAIVIGSTGARGGAVVIPLVGAKQEAPDTQAGGGSFITSIAPGAAVTAAAGGFVASGCLMGDGDAALTHPAGFTEMQDLDQPDDDDRIGVAYLTGASGDYTPSWSWTGAQTAVTLALRVNPA